MLFEAIANHEGRFTTLKTAGFSWIDGEGRVMEAAA
jgi:hypothetical protein